MTINRYLFGSAVLAALTLSACGGSYQYGSSAATPDLALAATVRAARLATPASLTRPDTPAEFMVAPAALTVASAPAAAQTLAIAVAEPAPAAPTAASAPAAPTSAPAVSATAPAASTPARMPAVVRAAAAPAVSAPEFASAALTAAPMPAALAPAPAALRVPAPHAYVQHAYASAPTPAVARSTSVPAPTPVAAEQNAEPAAAAATRRCCNTSALFAAARLALRTRTAEVAAARERLREVKEQGAVARKAVRTKTAEVAATRDRLRQAQAAVRDLLKLARADRSRRPELLDARRARDDAGGRLRAVREAAAAAWAERNRMLGEVADHAERVRQAEEALRAAEAAAARNAELAWAPPAVRSYRHVAQLIKQGATDELALRLRAYDTVVESAGVIVRHVDDADRVMMLGQVGRYIFGMQRGSYAWSRWDNLFFGYWPEYGYIEEAPTISGTWKGAFIAEFLSVYANREIAVHGGPASLEYNGETDRVTATIDLSAHPDGGHKVIATAGKHPNPRFGNYFRGRGGSHTVGSVRYYQSELGVEFFKEPDDGSVGLGHFKLRKGTWTQFPTGERLLIYDGRWRGSFGVQRVEEPAQ